MSRSILPRAWLPLALAWVFPLSLGGCGDDELLSAGCKASAGDLVDVSCKAGTWTPKACAAGTTTGRPESERDTAARHKASEPITYCDLPPTLGDHRPEWAQWGEYAFLPPQRWLHNLEHGGAAFLYHPCAPKEVVDALRAFALARPDDAGGRFRWVLTPFADLKTTIAVVTWGWKLEAPCVAPAEIEAYLQAHYRKAPEDFGFEGSFKDGHLPAAQDAGPTDAGATGSDAVAPADAATGS